MVYEKEYSFYYYFTLIGFLALQIPVARLEGSRVTFTVYDAFAPVAGSFIGSIKQIADFLRDLNELTPFLKTL